MHVFVMKYETICYMALGWLQCCAIYGYSLHSCANEGMVVFADTMFLLWLCLLTTHSVRFGIKIFSRLATVLRHFTCHWKLDILNKKTIINNNNNNPPPKNTYIFMYILKTNPKAYIFDYYYSLQEMVPSYLATSPIISEGSALMQAQMGKGTSRLSESGNGTTIQTLGPMQPPGDSSIMKKRRKRRRKSKVDSMKREDSGDSEDEDMFPIDMSSDDDDTEASGSRSEHMEDMERVF